MADEPYAKFEGVLIGDAVINYYIASAVAGGVKETAPLQAEFAKLDADSPNLVLEPTIEVRIECDDAWAFSYAIAQIIQMHFFGVGELVLYDAAGTVKARWREVALARVQAPRPINMNDGRASDSIQVVFKASKLPEDD